MEPTPTPQETPIPALPVAAPAPPPPRTPPPPPQPIYIRQGSVLGRLMCWLGWTGFILCGLLLLGQMIAVGEYFDTSEGITEQYHSGAKFAQEKVAIISIEGAMLDGDGFVKRQIDRVREDDQVKAIVLRVDSPGGTVTAADYMYHYLKRLREEKNLPMVVSMGGVAASGGYYVAMAVGDQEKAIFAEPTTTTGSIGVMVPHYDISGLLERFNVKDDSVATHPRKLMLSMTRPMSDDDRGLVKKYIEESFSRFKEIIKSGRPAFREKPEQLDELATGEIFSAPQALESGLVDSIGFIEEAIDRACELAHVKPEDVRVVEFERPLSLFGLSGMAASRAPRDSYRELLQLSTPRAYYLASTLPPWISTWQMLLPRD